MHPSETFQFLLTRILAYSLCNEPGLEFSASGLSDPEQPCISKVDPRGGYAVWIEVGNPSGRRLHKAAKAARVVKVYTYKDPQMVLDEISKERVHRGDEIEVFSFGGKFLDRLAALVQRDNSWTVVRSEGSVMITAGQTTESGELICAR